LCCIASPALCAAQDLLRWKFTTGDVLRYHMVQDTQSRTTVGTQSVKSSISQIIDQTWTVKTVADDGAAEIAMKFDHIIVRYDLPGGIIEVDTASKNPPQPELAAVESLLRAISQAELVATMTPEGEIRDVVIPDQIKKLIANRGAGQAMAASFTEDGLKEMVSGAKVALPHDPVSPEMTWTDEKQNQGFQVKLVYKLLGKETIEDRPLDAISITGEMNLAGQPLENLTLKLIQQELGGKLLFDNQAGRLYSLDIKQRVAIDITSNNTTGRQEVQVSSTCNLLLPGTPAAETNPAEVPTDEPAGDSKKESADTGLDAKPDSDQVDNLPAASSLRGGPTFTCISSPSTRVSYALTFNRGLSHQVPSHTRNRHACQGQATTPSYTSPAPSDAPMCGHKSSIAEYLPSA
jgi:hypothetical protein